MAAAAIDVRPAVHFSVLKAMAQSPMHYAYRCATPREDAKHFRLGRALDARVFGTSKVVVYDGERRGAKWHAFESANPGVDIITRKEEPLVHGMAAALLRRPDALELLRGERQKLIEWAIAGRPCAGTPDAFTPERIVDLKSARNVSPERFPYEARRLGYHAQLAWYLEGLALSGRARPSTAYIVAVESVPPHPVTVFELTERALDPGARTWRLWFERMRACEESGVWPGYSEAIVPLDVAEESDGFSLVVDGEETEIE